MKEILTKSENCISEYCCNVVKIEEVMPIPNSDFLGKVSLFGNTVVVRKDQVKEGDIMFYAMHETQLNEKFLSVNNLYEMHERSRNANFEEVEQLRNDGLMDEAKKKVGFFNKNSRVTMLRLRGVYSKGFLFSVGEMGKYCPEILDVDLTHYINKDFDTVNGELFVKVFVPPVKESTNKSNNPSNKNKKRVERFDRMIPGQFELNYDTDMLGKNMWKIKPDDSVVISVKQHGTSGIFSNCKTRIPIKLPFLIRMKNKFIDTTGWFKDCKTIDYRVDYDNVYASRKVIKNQYINKSATSGYYQSDVWGEVNEIIKPYIEKGMTIYGEICGYESNGKPIQSEYVYGCKPNEKFFMPYRITTDINENEKFEWNVQEIHDWTVNLIKEYPDLSKHIHPITILYHGTLSNLYPEISINEHWQENVLEAMKNDKVHFGMEMDEPMCTNKVPREGICLRIDNDPTNECFKLKCDKFYEKEGKQIDKGQVDMEMQEAYSEN